MTRADIFWSGTIPLFLIQPYREATGSSAPTSGR